MILLNILLKCMTLTLIYVNLEMSDFKREIGYGKSPGQPWLSREGLGWRKAPGAVRPPG